MSKCYSLLLYCTSSLVTVFVSISNAYKEGDCSHMFYKCKISKINICFWKLKLWKYRKINIEQMKREKNYKIYRNVYFFKLPGSGMSFQMLNTILSSYYFYFILLPWLLEEQMMMEFRG